MRVRPLSNADSGETLGLASIVLQGGETCRMLYVRAEALYQTAARAAAEYRVTRRESDGRAALAGAIIHSAVDCIADMDDDQTAALANGMLALRSCGKLNDAVLSLEVINDIRDLGASISDAKCLGNPLQVFGPLWKVQTPDWYRL